MLLTDAASHRELHSTSQPHLQGLYLQGVVRILELFVGRPRDRILVSALRNAIMRTVGGLTAHRAFCHSPGSAFFRSESVSYIYLLAAVPISSTNCIT